MTLLALPDAVRDPRLAHDAREAVLRRDPGARPGAVRNLLQEWLTRPGRTGTLTDAGLAR